MIILAHPMVATPKPEICVMIISHKYKFIFLKTSKTAGTSIEIALSCFCDKEDIVTAVSQEDEIIRKGAGGVRGEYYPVSKSLYHPVDWYKYLFKGKEKQYFYNHIPARKLKRRIRPDIWNTYYRFCVVRNPWDRVVSQYYWRFRNIPEENRPSLSTFLESSHVRSLQRKGYGLYTTRGNVAVDYICRYETLTEDLEIVRQQVGLPEKLTLPRAKSNHRKKKSLYRDFYNDSQRKHVAEIFADEIQLTGYRF